MLPIRWRKKYNLPLQASFLFPQIDEYARELCIIALRKRTTAGRLS